MKKPKEFKLPTKKDDMFLEKDMEYFLPKELYETWENYMRGKTCPLNEKGERGVYSWDLQQFIERYM